ncbi:3903_t:CDS:1, partial [Racocetra persica]
IGEETIEEIVEETMEDIVEETIEDIAKIAIAIESTDIAEEEQIVEQFDIDNNLYLKYINDQLI